MSCNYKRQKNTIMSSIKQLATKIKTYKLFEYIYALVFPQKYMLYLKIYIVGSYDFNNCADIHIHTNKRLLFLVEPQQD